MFQNNPIDILHDDILLEIISHLPYKSLSSVSLINKRFNQLVTIDSPAGRQRLTEFISHYVTRQLMNDLNNRTINFDIDSEQFVTVLMNAIKASGREDANQNLDPRFAPIVNKISALIANPDSILDDFPRENMPATIAGQFQKVRGNNHNKQVIIQNATHYATENTESILEKVKREHCKRKLKAGAALTLAALLIAGPLIAIFFIRRSPLDPNDDGPPPNYEYDPNDYSYLFDITIQTIASHMYMNLYLLQLEDRNFAQKFGEVAVVTGVGATMATTTVAAATAATSAVAATATVAGGTATAVVAVASNPVGWIVGASASVTALIGRSATCMELFSRQ